MHRTPMRIPQTNPVGLVEIPDGFSVTPRGYPAAVRIAAAVVLTAFLAVGVATTVYSLGAYCLTTDATVPFGFAVPPSR